jgi:small subunit ribosomal protein S4
MILNGSKVCQKCRRAGQKLFLKGDKCLSPKCPFSRRSYAPGQHGQNPIRLTQYGKQLREKQKAAQIYGISNTQFRNYYDKSVKKKEMTDLTLLRFLEMRLDSVIYRLNFATSRRQAKTFIKDGHILVNGKKSTSPSYQLKLKDVVEIKKSSQVKTPFKDLKEKLKKSQISAWLKLTKDELKGELIKIPDRSDIDTPVDEHVILEYFAR